MQTEVFCIDAIYPDGTVEFGQAEQSRDQRRFASSCTADNSNL